MVDLSSPHYLLFDASREDAQSGHCRFVLRNSDGSHRLEAEATEPGVTGERLALLSVVRGLEALENPSRVRAHYPQFLRAGGDSPRAVRMAEQRLAVGTLRADGAGQELGPLAAGRPGHAVPPGRLPDVSARPSPRRGF